MITSAPGASPAANNIIADAGYSYILGSNILQDYPVTTGGTPAVISSVLTKLDPSGNMVWSRYLPFSSSGAAGTVYSKILLHNGALYLLGSSAAADIPVTNGSVHNGGNDILFTKIDPNNGAILHNGYLGGNGGDDTGLDMMIDNGNVYITYTTTSSNIPVTTGPAFTSGWDHMVQKLDLSGNVLYSTYTGSVNNTSANTGQAMLKVENGIAYLLTQVNPVNNFITSNGTTVTGGADLALLRLDAAGNRTLATIIGGSGNENFPVLLVNNGEIYVETSTLSNNYPVTDGSAKVTPFGNFALTKFGSNGTIIFSGYRGGSTSSFSLTSPAVMQLKNGSIYLAFASATQMATVPVTDASTGGSALLKIDAASGALQFATRFGEIRLASNTGYVNMAIDDNAVYTVSSIQAANSGGGASLGAFVTDGSTRRGNSLSGTFVAKHSLDGQLLFASFLSGPSMGLSASSFFPAISNGKMYISGVVNTAERFPVTTTHLGSQTPFSLDMTWTVYNFCPSMPTGNTISPLSQSVCQNGFTQALTGNEIVYTSQQMPTLYFNGAPEQQNEIRSRYQWQVATSAAGPWTNIAAGTQKDYIPTPGTQSFYYRRLVLPPAGCGDTPVSISSVAEVIVGTDAAPTVTGGIFNTCVSSPVNISATVTGGTAPYTYAWDNGISSTTNSATVSPISNSVYTLTVTDANGCQQVGQTIVNAYAADAGPASVSSCAGNPVRIGAAPPAGLSGVTYSWTPTTGLDDPTAAQPLATPGVTTVYTLQMTVPVSGGGTCTTSDNITVNLVAAPVTPNFAGADQATCKGGNISLGAAAEAGFTYTWSPGSYLNNVATSATTFNAGTNLPQPNPFIYTATASRNGCSFTDQVRVAVLDVDAGEDYCGPRTVGTPDKMPGVTGKTYLWQVISGPGTITGTTSTATTTVSASASPTTYRVTVSYLGANCSDDVVVGACGAGGCIVEIDTLANHGCPSSVFGAVSLRARPFNLDPSQWTYTWSSVPAGGLSATTGHTITLTDNTERDVTVTVSRVDNPAVNCSQTIHVNDPSWSLPVFNAPDQAICPATNIGIGTTPVAGYGYTWKGVNLADINSSDPVVSPTVSTDYPVMVTDIGSGCKLNDTVKVSVKPLIINPGPDWLVCNNALIRLGSPAQPGYTYSWDPQVAAYQNGTTYQSAEPELLIAATQDFTLTVTDTETGCTADSTVHITVDGSTSLPPMADTTICPGGSATIGLPEWGGVTYSWSPATGLSSATVAQPVASPATTQTYTLTVTFYDLGGAPLCTKSGTVTVTVAAPQITMSDESICPSGPLYNLSNGVTATGAATYSWSPGLLVTSPNALNTTVKTNPGAPTTFTLTATDANGCTATASKTISPLSAAPEAGSQGYVCVGDNRKIGSPSNTGTLSWTVSPSIAGTLSPANGAEPVFTPAAADTGKTFTFTITQDVAGCINTDSVRILVRSLVLPVIPAQTVCMNTSTTIGVTAAPNVNYIWTPATGLTNPNASITTVSSVASNSVYTLTATDLYGCTATGTAFIGVNPVSAPTVNIPDVTVTVGSAGMPFSPQISPAPGDYTYTWTPSNQVNDPYIANAQALTTGAAGTYTYNLSVTDENGCTTTAPARLNVVHSTLPVKLSSFTAKTISCGVRLTWKVESFENFSRFIIERKGDDGNFNETGVVQHDLNRNHYQFDDVDPGNGNWAYRLKLVDEDGKFSYSSTARTTINCAAGNSLVIYPNPVNDHVYIKISQPVRSITLLSATGSILMKKEYNQVRAGITLVPLRTGLAQGIYFLQINTKDGRVVTAKLVKE